MREMYNNIREFMKDDDKMQIGGVKHAGNIVVFGIHVTMYYKDHMPPHFHESIMDIEL